LFGVGCTAQIEEAVPSGGGETAIPSIMEERLCNSTGLVWYEQTCYECNGFVFKKEEEILCGQCPEGFEYKDEKCKAEMEQKMKIPSILILGFVALVIIGILFKKSKRQQKKQLEKLQKKFKEEKKVEPND